ncbi:hypothetical protein BDV93DRAFT_557510 [Ceratobasidium sp. AG-I]|nr:hypothetical protein BDV93DRAFT_557510 [Ceratobasidium sp. AG-I]
MVTRDYHGLDKDLVDLAGLHTCVRFSAQGMFKPSNKAAQIMKQCWDNARIELKISKNTFPFTDQHLQIKSRLNSYRGRVRDKLLPYIINPNAPPGTGQYQHSCLETAVYLAFFMGKYNIDVKFPNFCKKLPLKAIAFVCAMTQYIIELFKTGKHVKEKMEFDTLRGHYIVHITSLEAFAMSAQKVHCELVQHRLYTRAMVSAGAEIPQVAPSARNDTLSANDFAVDEPTEEELAELRTAGWNSVSKALQNDAQGLEEDTYAGKFVDPCHNPKWGVITRCG